MRLPHLILQLQRLRYITLLYLAQLKRTSFIFFSVSSQMLRQQANFCWVDYITPSSRWFFSSAITRFFSSSSVSRIWMRLLIRLFSTIIWCTCSGTSVRSASSPSFRETLLVLILLRCIAIYKLIYSFKQIMIKQNGYKIYSIGSKAQDYEVEEIQDVDFYTRGKSCRKAIVGELPGPNEIERRNFQFRLDHNNGEESKYGERRLYELYDKEFNIFSEEYFKQSYMEVENDEEDLPTFLSEFSMIDREYIKTRFFTKTLNKEGYYQYFVRRNGEYYVDYIDDYIPVQGTKQLPIWGLTLKEPWKLIIMKAWLKEKGGIDNVIKAQPYEFIEAFGLPGYRALSIKKEVNFLKVSKLPNEVKAQKEKRIRLNEPGFITVGKTRNNKQVRELGLKQNRAGYKIVPIESLSASHLGASSIANEDNIYKVQSEQPVYWVGEYSVVSSKIRQSYNPHVHKLNIEKEFLATYSEISNVFSKFYITPEYSSKYGSGNIIEDSYRFVMSNEDNTPYYVFQLEVGVKGFLNLNVDLPSDSAYNDLNGNERYSPIQYFMTKEKADDKGSKLGGYQFYDGEYMKGYHKSLNRFLEVVEGKYYIYVKIDNNRKHEKESREEKEAREEREEREKREKKEKSFAININTNAVIRKFRRTEDLTPEVKSNIFKASFYEYSKQAGIRCYVHKEVKDLLVYICNKFDELGFSFISLYVHPNAKGDLAMSIDRNKLLENKINLCEEAHGSGGNNFKDGYKLVARPGQPEILVLQRTERSRSKEEQFPPEGSIDFYEIY